MTIFGLDFSHYDAVPSGAEVVKEGFQFFTHKAGGDANDDEIAAWWTAMKPYRDKVLLGAYWVLYPGTPADRADAFLARLDATCPGWRDGPFILQADCEEWNGDSGTVPSVAEINAFGDRLKAKMPKLQMIAYAPDWVYGSLSALKYPVWSSKYVTGTGTASGLYPGDNASQWAAYGGKTPSILQFSSKVTALGQTTCDANAYRGTLAELTSLVAPGWDTDMALTAADANVIWNDDIITNPKQRADSPLHTPPGTNKTTAAAFAIGDMWARIEDNYDNLNALAKTIASMAANINTANSALSALAAKVDGSAPVITQDQLDLAVLNALKTLAGGQS